MEQEMNVGIYFLDDQGTDRSLLFYKDLEDYSKTLPGVVSTWTSHAHPHCADCISSTIKKLGLKILIIVGDYPGLLKPYFSQVLADAGISDGEVEMLSFAEHNLTMDEPEAIRHALRKVVDQSWTPLLPIWNGHQVHQDTLVIGGGIAGIQASLEIADAGKKVLLIEKQIYP